MFSRRHSLFIYKNENAQLYCFILQWCWSFKYFILLVFHPLSSRPFSFIPISISLPLSRSVFSVSAFQYFEIFNCNWCYLSEHLVLEFPNEFRCGYKIQFIEFCRQRYEFHWKELQWKKRDFIRVHCNVMHLRGERDLRERKYLMHAIEKWSVNFFGSQYITICKGKRIIKLKCTVSFPF